MKKLLLTSSILAIAFSPVVKAETVVIIDTMPPELKRDYELERTVRKANEKALHLKLQKQRNERWKNAIPEEDKPLTRDERIELINCGSMSYSNIPRELRQELNYCRARKDKR